MIAQHPAEQTAGCFIEMASATFGEPLVLLFVAGAAFGEPLVPFFASFVASAAFGASLVSSALSWEAQRLVNFWFHVS